MAPGKTEEERTVIYEVNNVTFAYTPKGPDILKNVSFSVKESQVISILGPNGAGKSTLLGCMAGLLKPKEGSILLKGSDISSLRQKQIASVAGFVPQNHEAAFSYTVREYVLMGRASRIGIFSRPGKEDEDAAEQAMDEMGILSLADKPYTKISGGERQQAAIARAIAQEPEIILFDEPTSHLDFGNQLRVLRIIRKLSDKGFAIVITTHNPDHALLLGCDAALLDKNGHLETGSCDEMITEEKLGRIYSADLKIRYMPEEGRKVCIYPKL